jgi:hypothetical protein
MVVMALAMLGHAAPAIAGSPPSATRSPPPVPPFALCETAIDIAESAGRLPPGLLIAIAEEESGRRDQDSGLIRPWPWTINAEGEGHYYHTKAQAIEAVRTLQARGVRSVDVGCMQINLFFHAGAFATLEEAFDPHANALYAAHFLNMLYAAGHDWPRAIGAYHSETPALAAPYRTLVLARWQRPHVIPAPVAQVAYRAFVEPQQVYGAFAPTERAYGAWAVSSPVLPPLVRR